MRILIIGGGGREHALAWRLKQSATPVELFATPGNPGLAKLGICLPAPLSIPDYAALAADYRIDLTLVGPEAPLVEGVVDEFYRRRLKIVGPTRAAAQLEGSKIFAKRFFERAGIPSARSMQTTSFDEALCAIKYFSFPVVIKADGLHAGKGVVIAQDEAQARAAMERLGPELVIEEYLEGEELSFIGLSNGHFFAPFAPSQDHKRIFDNDQGPNTGGMGAYTDPRLLSNEQTGEIMERIILPTLHHMRVDGHPFTGFLYAGLMMTAEGPKILEYNVRLGDPETQAIMHGFEGDLVELLGLMVNGVGTLRGGMWGRPSVAITLAAQNYPDKPRTGDYIEGLEAAESEGAVVFHAGTTQVDGRLMTGGGRVLSVTAGADTLPMAMEKAYAAARHINFDGAQYRRDIGRKGLKRW